VGHKSEHAGSDELGWEKIQMLFSVRCLVVIRGGIVPLKIKCPEVSPGADCLLWLWHGGRPNVQ
jgi:hypothetical protein